MFLFLFKPILSIWMHFSPFFHSSISKTKTKTIPQIITISPGGYRGYYLLGVTSYLKEHFDTSQYIFSGASAGAWFSLMMTYRGNHSKLLENLNVLSPEFMKLNLKQIQSNLSKTILEKYTTEDFDLKRLAIGVSRIRPPFYVETSIYHEFRDLKDVVECCQASSHIPFITAGMFCFYDRRLAFDGGFSNYPYLRISDTKPVLHIFTNLWKEEEKEKEKNPWKPKVKNLRIAMEQTTVFSKNKYNLLELYMEGYQKTANNHATLSKIFPRIYPALHKM